ncbi:hypothetical protein GCM10009661_19250 [Catellatospora chokoriensis]|uniref:Uncharacterized protein n=1 Tax=Catellatospora chokoriensis TaxID=310353 RepID=A0A8J3K1Q8_9ACTN|nr:hypothetical protein Cch02nite_59030 [Catellatospora chokoriensis]
MGVGYGLGVFSWVPTVHGGDEAAWLASLAWTVWISALSVVLGAVVADRVGQPTVQSSTAVRVLRRAALSIAASLGGLVVVALTAVPARVAERADTFAPHLIVGAYAIAGVLLGLFISVAALVARSIAANVLATGGWLWLLAVTAVADGIAAGRDPVVAQLGSWPVTTDGPWFKSVYLPGAAIAAVAAVVIGFLAALPAARRRDGQAGVALSGAAGPALVAVAYLLAAPRLTGALPDQLSAHLVAPYAVVTGLLGSVLALVLCGPRRPRPVTAPAAPVPPQYTGSDAAPAPAVPAQPVPDKTGSGKKASDKNSAAGDSSDKAASDKPASGRTAAGRATVAKATADDTAAQPPADEPSATGAMPSTGPSGVSPVADPPGPRQPRKKR